MFGRKKKSRFVLGGGKAELPIEIVRGERPGKRRGQGEIVIRFKKRKSVWARAFASWFAAARTPVAVEQYKREFEIVKGKKRTKYLGAFPVVRREGRKGWVEYTLAYDGSETEER